ncbi:MAG: potassium channel protein [Planctomycetota bacterium]
MVRRLLPNVRDESPSSILLRRVMPMSRRRPSTGPVTRLLSGLVGFAMVSVFGATAYRFLGWNWSDGIYMVIITIFTVGYGEVRPVDTMELRVVTISVIVFGYAATLLIIGGLAQLILDGELRQSLETRRMVHEIRQLRDHVIICGYGRMGQRLASKLRLRRDVLVIDPIESCVQAAMEDGLLALCGSASDEKLLRAAGVERAGVLAAVIPDDATCLFITITARGLNTDLKILSRGEHSSTVSKLRQVGADHVVLTAAIGADRLSQLILRPTASAMLRNDELPSGLMEDLESIGMAIDELIVDDRSTLCGRTIGELSIREENRFLIVAVRRSAGEVLVDPQPETTVEAGDSVVVLGHDVHIHQLCDRFRLQRNAAIVAEREADSLQE